MNKRRLVMKGVDLSHWNGSVVMKELREECEFVILKIGGEETEAGKLTIDRSFFRRYHAAVKAGLHVGGYFFMSKKPEVFNTYPDHICSKLEKEISGIHFDMPLYIDVEGQPRGHKTNLTNYVKEWCSIMESLNYYVGIYGSDVSTFHDLLDIDKLFAYDKWVARYGKEPQYVKNYGMWQATNKGVISGVAGYCDVDYAYIDYPAVIEKKGLNK